MTHEKAIELIKLQMSILPEESEVKILLQDALDKAININIRIRNEFGGNFVFVVMDMIDERRSKETWTFDINSLPIIKDEFIRGGAMNVLFRHHAEASIRQLIELKSKLGATLNIGEVVEEVINKISEEKNDG